MWEFQRGETPGQETMFDAMLVEKGEIWWPRRPWQHAYASLIANFVVRWPLR